MIVQHLMCHLRNKVHPIVSASKYASLISPTVMRQMLSTSSVVCRKAVIKREEYFLKKDNIPAGFNIIYRAPMQHYLSDVCTWDLIMHCGGIYEKSRR